ncbi:MAG: hypothetical protein AAFN79_00265 [Pseudomonadota bacterium]
MVDKRDDDRSMSEILASIRKIVSDEETTRREAEETRRRDEAGSGGEVLVLSGDMRTARPASPPVEPEAAEAAPLDLSSAATQLSLGEPKAAAAQPKVDFAPAPGLTASEVEEIVRRVVREELQGPIGQQISRKVKALIRHEVSKAIGEDESLI